MDKSRRVSATRWLPPWEVWDDFLPEGWPNGFRATWIEVDLEALHHNLKVIRSYLPSKCSVAAVVKDNAYGHGMIPVARFLASRVEMLAVAILEEASLLRKAGIRCPVLIMNGLWPGQEMECLERNAVAAVSSWESLWLLEKAAQSKDHSYVYHLKLDTGMHRWGIPLEELETFLEKAAGLHYMQCAGLLTHLACADELDPSFTRRQLELFRHAVSRVQERGIPLQWIHAANSAGVMYHFDSHFNLVRPGIALYGYDPRGENAAGRLQPVLSLKSRIAMVKRIKAGDSIGYGASHVLNRNADVAVIPVGYGDGYSRLLSDRSSVLIGDQYAPVIGRVSMDAITADVSRIPEATVGREVVLLGGTRSNRIWADHLARQIGTIPYEILTNLSPRIGRIYLHRSGDTLPSNPFNSRQQ